MNTPLHKQLVYILHTLNGKSKHVKGISLQMKEVKFQKVKWFINNVGEGRIKIVWQLKCQI